MTVIPKQNLYKWIGGKKWLTKKLQEVSKNTIMENKSIYIEPFLGGMGAFLALLPILQDKGIKTFVLNDINGVVIDLLKEVKTNPSHLYDGYNKLMTQMYDLYPTEVFNLHQTKDKELIKKQLRNAELFFKRQRKRFNVLKSLSSSTQTQTTEKNILFLFLMKNAFNGIYRENAKGEFNTPFNWNNKREVKGVENILMEYSVLFNTFDIKFENKDVFELLNEYKGVSEDVFIYLDPPYMNEEGGENQYSKDSFNETKQMALLDLITNTFDNFIYSNHSIDKIKGFFPCYEEVERKNIMSSVKETRSDNKKEILGLYNKKITSVSFQKC